MGSRFKGVKPKSLQIFARQLATMIEAGVSVVAALVTLEEQTDDKVLHEVIGEVRADVESGLILSRALGRHPKVFNRLFVAMVSAGESSGTLDTVLDRIATQIEKDTKLKRRVKSAMVYPTVVITFASIVLVFMLMFIVPVFQSVFAQLNGQLPAPTQIVVDMSHLLRNWWYIIFPLIGLASGRCVASSRRPRERQWWDQFKLRVPMKIGDVVHKIALARLSRTLATLVAAGVDIITALDIAGSTAGNWVVEQSMIKTSERVHDGVPISVPLADDPIFPPMVSQMVKIGEETGELDKMLEQDRRLLRGRGRREHRSSHIHHRAADDDRRRRDGRNDRHRDVPADVQAPDPDQVERSRSPSARNFPAPRGGTQHALRRALRGGGSRRG